MCQRNLRTDPPKESGSTLHVLYHQGVKRSLFDHQLSGTREPDEVSTSSVPELGMWKHNT